MKRQVQNGDRVTLIEHTEQLRDRFNNVFRDEPIWRPSLIERVVGVFARG